MAEVKLQEGETLENALRRFKRKVQQEDIIICESVQRGLNSGFCDQGRLVLRYEKGIQHFERLVFDALTGHQRREGTQ